MAELIGRVNGQSNIYTGIALYNKNQSGLETELNHRIAFITDKPVENGNIYDFKNKEAIVIDPWLGITDFVSEYFGKLKTILRHNFPEIPNSDILIKQTKERSDNYQDFQKKRKHEIPRIHFRIMADVEKPLNEKQINLFQLMYPELKLQNYKPVTDLEGQAI